MISKSKITLGVIGILALFVLISAIGYGWQWVTAAPKGKLEARKEINSGATRITAYEHFFNLCASVQATEQTLSASYEELKNAPASDLPRIKTNITGLLANRARSVAQYNADARKDYTIGQFRDSNLPYQIDLNYDRNEVTLCEN